MSSHLNYEFGSPISNHQQIRGLRKAFERTLTSNEMVHSGFYFQMLYLLDDSLADAVLNAYKFRNSSATICENLCQSVSHFYGIPWKELLNDDYPGNHRSNVR